MYNKWVASKLTILDGNGHELYMADSTESVDGLLKLLKAADLEIITASLRGRWDVRQMSSRSKSGCPRMQLVGLMLRPPLKGSEEAEAACTWRSGLLTMFASMSRVGNLCTGW